MIHARAILLSLLLLIGLAAGPGAAACDARQTKITLTPEAPRTPAVLERHEKLADEARFADPDVLLIGDSLASKWPEQLVLKAFNAKSSINYGMPGDRVQNVVWRLENSRLKTMSPKLVALIVGTNNLKYARQPPCAIAAGVKLALERIREAWPYVKIVVIEVPPRFERPDPEFDTRRGELNKLLAQVVAAMTDARIINVDGALACEGSIETCPVYARDGLHFSGRGYAAIAERLSAALTQPSPAR